MLESHYATKTIQLSSVLASYPYGMLLLALSKGR